MKVLGCGDVFINRSIPKDGYQGFDELISAMQDYEVKFCNLETTVHDNEGYPSAFPGGGWAMAPSSILKDIKKFGFNTVSLANNHAMDYSHKGLEATLHHLRENDLSFVGAGMNLMEATLPCYVECREGRVAIIAVTSSFHDSDAAGPAGGIVPGRPGVNPLRHSAEYQVTPDIYQSLETVVATTNINDTYQWSMKNGYMNSEDSLHLRGIKFSLGDENRKISRPFDKDMERISRSIEEARVQADYVIISVHSHQMSGNDDTPDDFIVQFCHNCVDLGASAIICHGAHTICGIELYENCPIFYGLGDFVLQNENVTALPREFYEKYNIDFEYQDYVGLGMMTRSENETKGLSATPYAWQGIMAGLEFNGGGKIEEVKIWPIELDYMRGRTKRGWPHIEKNMGILKRVQVLSLEQFHTVIKVEDGIGYLVL